MFHGAKNNPCRRARQAAGNEIKWRGSLNLYLPLDINCEKTRQSACSFFGGALN
jgi:hypothetical protein